MSVTKHNVERCRLYKGLIQARIEYSETKLKKIGDYKDCVPAHLEYLLTKNEIYLLQNMLTDVDIKIDSLELIDKQASLNPISYYPIKYRNNYRYTTLFKQIDLK